MSETREERWGAWLALFDEDLDLALDLAARVDRGARLLDEKRSGWAEAVNLDELAMDSCDDCIIGQVFSHYELGLARLGLDYSGDLPKPMAGGFDLSGEDISGRNFAALANLWRNQVRKRLAGRSEAVRENGGPLP